MHKKIIITLMTTTGLLGLPTNARSMNAVIDYNPKNSLVVTVAEQDLSTKAQAFVTDMAENGIMFLQDKSLTEEQKKKEFRKFLDKNFDLNTIARFALGRYWNTVTAAEKKKYLSLFEDMVVDVYSRRFGDYNGESLMVTSARPQSDSDALVASKIIPKTGSEVRIDWRVRKKKDGSLKVVDIIVEGVSMSLTQRSDFASVIQRGGGKVETLIAHLEKEN